MEPGEVRKAIQRITKEVKEFGTVERAVKIARMGEKKMTERDDHTIIDYTYTDEKLRVHQSNYNYGPYYIHVDFEGCRVLEANFEEKVKGSISKIRVDVYHPGWWTNILNVKEIKDRLKADKVQAKLEAGKTREKADENRPLTQEEQLQAEKLGLIPKRQERFHSYR